MKKINFKIVSTLLAVIVLVGCTDNFKDINTDPNSATKVPTAYLMTNAQRGVLGQRYNFTTTLYAQHWAQTQYTNGSRYETAEASFNGYYSSPLMDLRQVIKLNTDEETKNDAAASGDNINQIAVANILKVLTFQYITDMWGDIPYGEALLGVENYTPAYDMQESIYRDFLVTLDAAIGSINTSPTNELVGDVIFNGDMAKWKMFANALKMRVAIRMSGVDLATSNAAIAAAMPNAFTGNADNALYPYLSDADNDNPVWAHFLTRTDYAVSDVLVAFMNDRNDPRLPIYGDEAPNFAPDVIGMPYGVDNSIAGLITNDEISFPGQAVRSATSPGILMTYAEQKFIEAEYLERTGGAAQTAYEAAITASMEFWGVDAADIATYLADPLVDYAAAADVYQVIGEQKWLALYTDGHEAWAEWRRTSWPMLVAAPDAVEGRDIPRRRAYTQAEYDLNKANVEEAVARQGADLMDTKMWWDPGRQR